MARMSYTSVGGAAATATSTTGTVRLGSLPQSQQAAYGVTGGCAPTAKAEYGIRGQVTIPYASGTGGSCSYTSAVASGGSSPIARTAQISSLPTSRIPVGEVSRSSYASASTEGASPAARLSTTSSQYKQVSRSSYASASTEVASPAARLSTTSSQYNQVFGSLSSMSPAPAISASSQSGYPVAASSITQPFATSSVPQPLASTSVPQPVPSSQVVAPTLLSSQTLSSPATCNPVVEYYSNSRGGWIPATFQGFNTEFNTYTLDVQPYARPGDVRLAPGAAAEYFSKSRGGWVPAKVESFNEEFGVYALDVQPYAKPEDVRLAGFPEALEAPCTEGRPSGLRSRLPTMPIAGEGLAQEPLDEEEDPAVTQLLESLTASDRLPVGARVEYFTKEGIWVKAKVQGFNEELGTYALDVRPFALAGSIRLPGPIKETAGAPGATGGEEAVTPAAEAEGEEGSPEETPPERKLSTAQFTLQKQREGGRTAFAVFIESTDGKQIRAFDTETTSFEFACEAENLRTWLNGLSSDMLPGLLTLLQWEVSSRHERLEELQKEKDSYRGIDDYNYFGLSEDSTEKEIDRAYRNAAKELHPDKGGNEEEFADMRRRYEQLKANREEGPNKKEVSQGDPLCWDPADRSSMLRVHDRMRNFLVWVCNDLEQIAGELEELRKRHTAVTADRRCLVDGQGA